MNCTQIALLSSLFFGQIELNQPVDATARLVLTEPDINRALNSDYIRSKIPNLELNVLGQTAIIEPLQMEIHLPCDGYSLLTHSTRRNRQD